MKGKVTKIPTEQQSAVKHIGTYWSDREDSCRVYLDCAKYGLKMSDNFGDSDTTQLISFCQALAPDFNPETDIAVFREERNNKFGFGWCTWMELYRII